MKFFSRLFYASSCQFSHSPNDTILRIFSFLSYCSKKSISLSYQLYQQESTPLFRVLISINKLTITIVAVEEGQVNILGYDLGVET